MSLETVKKIFIIAGPNGVGKTTFAREFLPDEAACLQFVNADLIAAGLSPFAPEAAALQAGRLMLKQIADHVAHGRSFALETTLAGLAYARQIPQWRALGYAVSLHFLALPSVDLAIERVAQRVKTRRTPYSRRRDSPPLCVGPSQFDPLLRFGR